MERTRQELLKEIQDFYELRHPTEILNFLHRFPFLIPLLVELIGEARRYFGDIEIALELTHYSDADSPPVLFALLLVDLPLAEAMDRLDRFDREWWVNASDRAYGLLNVDVEYVR